MKLLLRTVACAVLALPLLACSKKDDKTPAAQPAAETKPAPAEPAAAPPAETKPAPAATPDVSADLPPECTEYAALVEKLKTCDKLGAARTALTQAYDNLRAAWTSVPADRRSEVTSQCKTQAESLRNATAATCGL